MKTLKQVQEMFVGGFVHEQYVNSSVSPDYCNTLLCIEFTAKENLYPAFPLNDDASVVLTGMNLDCVNVAKSRFEVVAPSADDPEMPAQGSLNLAQFAVQMGSDFDEFIDIMHDVCTDFGFIFQAKQPNEAETQYPEGINRFTTNNGLVYVFKSESQETDFDFYRECAP